jgi:fused signal recognition particle receptor
MFDFRKKTEQGVKRSREGWFSKVAQLFDRNRIEDDVWDELEELLISADVGMDTTEKLLENVKARVKAEKLSNGSDVRSALQEEMVKILSVNGSQRSIAAPGGIKIILVIGVNGSGKTTTIAKLAHSFKKDGKKVVLAAADTFRAAAIDQLKLWGDRVGVDVVAHQPNADPGAVVFDAIQAAQNRDAQVVIIDTAGRLHTKFNLMEELKKIKRVATRQDMSQEVLLIIDATTGQNGLVQAREFGSALEVDGIILTKLDGTAKGGIAVAIARELQIPILRIGVGESIEDLKPFVAHEFAHALVSGE